MRKAAPPRTIHYTELSESKPGDFFFDEWNAYLRELPRLLAEGNEGKFGLFKGDVLLGVFDAWEDGKRMGYLSFGLEPFMLRTIHEFEPLIRLPTRFFIDFRVAAEMIAELNREKQERV